MKVATAAQMRAIDRRAIEVYGIPGIVLMENAALQVLAAIELRYPRYRALRIAVVAGRGNNGGDGCALARHLFNRGVAVRLILVADPATLQGDARVNYEAVVGMGVPRLVVAEGAPLDELARELAQAGLIIDALLGTGLTSAARDFLAQVIRRMNEAPGPIVAVDLPSGLQADSGAIPGEHARAQLTVTFALPKLGVLLYPAAAAVGELVVADIGIPPAAVEAEGIAVELIEEAEVRAALPARSPDGHKGSYGHVLVVAGSPRLAGAAMMSSLAALRSGAGLVTLAWPQGLQSRASTGLMEIMTLPLAENEEGSLHPYALKQLSAFSRERGINAMVLGPGITTHPDSTSLCREILRELACPCVVDADGLNALAGHPEAFAAAAAPLVLTPHPGELARLLGCGAAQVQADRLEAARAALRRFNQTLILKGARSLVVAPASPLAINPTGNAGMASAGMGDVLSGMLGSLLAQGLPPYRAARAAVFLHGLAGDLAAETTGQAALIARDVLAAIPAVLKRMGW
ncbi:MAG: NAD(P)H-hydrate dehydratase [Candidatus Tectomicrobia bacterium]|nr:NAD(P)H-hydrate dehydratase [Candidatus Tectomicrobia bacterium]